MAKVGYWKGKKFRWQKSKLNPKTVEEALSLSIEKWEWIRDNPAKIRSEGSPHDSDTCALCQFFDSERSDDLIISCSNGESRCPLVHKTRDCCKEYADAANALDFWDFNEKGNENFPRREVNEMIGRLRKELRNLKKKKGIQ